MAQAAPMTAHPDAPLLERTDPALARPLPDELARARADIVAAATDVLALPPTGLDQPWSWIGGSEVEIRYAAYWAAEALELAEAEARTLLAATEHEETRAARIIGPATAARWDLNGLLLALPGSLLDADPGNGEWTVRLTAGHVISGQRAYGWGTAWWAANRYDVADPSLPARVPDDVWQSLPDEATTEAEGTADDLRARLDAHLDLAAERLAALPDPVLAQGARWSGFPVTLGFRLGRWSSHIREHTIQVEKTLPMLGHVPDEPARLARHVLAAYGRAEASVFGRAPGDAASAAAARLAKAAADSRSTVASAAQAAGVSR
jgi:hypothetical protein